MWQYVKWLGDCVIVRQQSAAAPSGTPVLYEAALLSPRALADAYGAASPEADASVGALAALVGRLQSALGSLHGDRCGHARLPCRALCGAPCGLCLQWRLAWASALPAPLSCLDRLDASPDTSRLVLLRARGNMSWVGRSCAACCTTATQIMVVGDACLIECCVRCPPQHGHAGRGCR